MQPVGRSLPTPAQKHNEKVANINNERLKEIQYLAKKLIAIHQVDKKLPD